MFEQVYNLMGTGSAVVNVAKDVQLVDGKALNDVRNSGDEVVGAAGRDNGINNNVDISCLVCVLGSLVQELLYNVGKVGRKRFSHLRAGVLARYISANGYEMMQRNVIPVGDIGLGCFHKFQLLLGVIDERAELAFLGFAQRGAEKLINFSLDISRSVLQNVLKSFVFTVYIGNEMLGGLGQIKDGLQVYYLCTGLGYCWEGVGKKLQVAHVFPNVVVLAFLHVGRINCSFIVYRLCHHHLYVPNFVSSVNKCSACLSFLGINGIKPSVRPRKFPMTVIRRPAKSSRPNS